MKKNILFLMQLPPPVHGASVVNKNIKDSDIINKVFKCSFINISLANGMDNIGKFGFLKIIKFIILLLKVFTITIKGKFDIVYITLSPHGSAFYKDSLLFFIAKLFINKSIIHLHGKGIKQELEGSKYRKLIYYSVFKKSSIIHLSDILYDDISGLIKNNKKYTLPNAIITNKKNNNAYISNSLGNKITFLYLSNMVLQKGWKVALLACSILKKQGYVFTFIFSGNWTKSSKKIDFDKLINQLDLTEHVKYIGPKYDQDKYNVFEICDIFVFPTFFRNECFPLSILEAFSYGLPAISTSEGAISEIVDHEINGYIVDRNNAEALAEAMLNYIKNPKLLISHQLAAIKKFNENYKFEKFEKKFIQILKEVENY